MSEWWTYRPSDFLLFSPRVYERLIESHNAGVWPWQLAALAAGLVLIGLVRRGGPQSGRAALALAGAGLAMSGWGFLWSRYAGINWAAAYAAPAFLTAGAGFAAVAALLNAPLRPTVRPAGALAAVLLALAVIAYPLAAPSLGKPWSAAEIAGVMPDPSALAALGVAALVRRPFLAAALAAVPALWSLYAAMTLFTLGAPEAWLIAAGLALFVAAVTARAVQPYR
ncbi:DUF6064 family protein [Chenggangzhangella methanolivorans]|uniref:DUF6064 family protein n=1 Tax=Chenggangzhangella methanolivorans TaxID=1437009 RepID=A0A9E6UMM8_9HYPH|nr:DUF6064 family protein [Chenggangzhangella methanolivorans]QZO00166.1 DUF6064 family protein [Chenggangzhangella methanolivorans]